MSHLYLKNLFEMSILDMAMGRKSLSQRLGDAYQNYLFKIQWDKDLKYISKEKKRAFQELEKLLWNDIESAATKQRLKDREFYLRIKCPITDEQLSEMTPYDSIRRKMHWRKAKRAAEIICDLYRDLLWLLSEQGRKNV